jgi:CPA2 family monovalent cation:H+ antiporter-2
VLHLTQWARNRELPILLAIVLALGSAIVAHQMNLSPAIGAFLAGLLLGGSPFAVQIRSDISALRTVLVTLFFASIGMFANTAWALDHVVPVIATVAALVACKALIVMVVMILAGQRRGVGLATGLCLAQVGEFSFVIAEIAVDTGLISTDVFDLAVASTILTLLLTPYMLRAAPHVARLLEGMRRPGRAAAAAPDQAHAPPPILIVGFGPAGQRVAEALMSQCRDRLVVIDSNPRNLKMARSYGLRTQIGDGTRREVLEHAGIGRARAIVITVPAVDAVRQMIHMARHLNPDATVLARARYHVFRWELQFAGAHVVVDEEDELGMSLSRAVQAELGSER